MNVTINPVSLVTGLFDSDPQSASSVKKRAPFELVAGETQ
jgi:hypothetical protein